jgi:hypothetical protein
MSEVGEVFRFTGPKGLGIGRSLGDMVLMLVGVWYVPKPSYRGATIFAIP